MAGACRTGCPAPDPRWEEPLDRLPADEVDQLFSRFFRTTTATRNAVPGVGLGLAITRSVVVAHGGVMEVTSTEGEGATFTAVLPRRRREPAAG